MVENTPAVQAEPVDETKIRFDFKKRLSKKIIIPAIAVGAVLLIILTVMTIINNARADKIEDYLSGKILITDTTSNWFKVYTFKILPYLWLCTLISRR